MKIYLTGASGFLGSNLLRVGQELFGDEFFAAVHAWQPSTPPPFQIGRVDLGDGDAVRASVRAFQPDVIIHSAIMSGLDSIYRDRAQAWRAYVQATHNLTDAANECGAKIILVSTDWVFDGTQTGADESTPPNPINYYGVLKVACERVVAERGANWAVARVAGVNGVHWLRREDEHPQNPGYGHFAAAVVASLRRGQPFTVWLGENVNRRATPTLATDAAEMILKIAHGGAQGIFHCTGGESIERFEFALRTAAVFGLDAALIRASASTAALPQGARIPADTSVEAQYTARALNHTLLDVQGLLTRFKRQLETGEIQGPRK